MSVDAAPAPRYRGPSALGDDLRRFWSLTITLAATDFKLRFFGSVLGYLWTLVRPLLLFGVIYVVFTEIVRFGAGVEHYPVYLLTSIVLFSFFGEATSRGVTSLVERENLLRKIRFPRLVIPLSVALASLFNLLANMIAVFVFVFISGIDPRPDWVQVPLLIAMLVVLATGVTMLVSALYVRYRDMDPIWEVALQLLFYASPILYVITFVPEDFRQAGSVQPDRHDPHADAPRPDRRERPDGPDGARRVGRAADSGGNRGRHLRGRLLGLLQGDAAHRREPLRWPANRKPRTRSLRPSAASSRSRSATTPRASAAPTPQWRPPRTRAIGSSAGRST